MHIIERLEEFHTTHSPLILTIGNFDGMHRGHSAVLKSAKEMAGTEGQTLVLTFRNHPSEIIKPDNPAKLLCTLPHKLLLLQQSGIDQLLLLTFSRYIAQHSATLFIEHIRRYIPFTHLVLGHDATLGRDKQGDRTTMQKLGEEWGFNVYYLDEYRFEGKPVSSTRIREALQTGDLALVEDLLGRPYSIYAPVMRGEGRGKLMGFPTANLELTGLCLPPYGVYAVEMHCGTHHVEGIANLGIAPTIMNRVSPLLEVHLFEDQELYGQSIEVVFKSYIRPEKKFHSPEELREQIKQDIAIMKNPQNRH